VHPPGIVSSQVLRGLAGILGLLALAACGRSPGGTCTLDQALGAAGPEDLVPVLIELDRTPDPMALLSVGSPRHRRHAELTSALRAGAQSAQGPLLERLRRGGAVDIQPLWIVNAVAAKVSPALARALPDVPGVRSVRLDATIQAPRAAVGGASAAEWNVEAIHAPALWDRGFDGTGVVVATMDTGVDWGHPDLQSRWRGGTTSWWDPYRATTLPYDVDGHGTQTMGLLLGGTAGGTAIGAAPGARWIAAKVYDDTGSTTLSTLHRAFQWLLEPSGDPGAPQAPDVVNASWGVASPGCDLTFEPDLQALHAAGIVVVFAAGNDGPNPGTDLSPGNNPDGYAAGAVDATLAVDRSSSRGPSACTSRVFPDVVAPGVNVRTADRSLAGQARYTNVSGTSFAAPHVAGVAALLLGAFPGTPVTDIEDILRNTADDLAPTGPDNDSGHGLVDAEAAYLALGGSTPVRITTAALPDSYEGVSFSARLQAVGGITPYQWSLAAGTLPPGLELSTGGVLSGIPTLAGTYPLTVAVRAGDGSSAQRALVLDVSSVTLAITTVALPPGKVGEAYAQTLVAVGGTPPYVWTLSLVSCATPLPPGLVLDRSSGLLSGMPTARGTFGFVARVSDAGGHSASRTLSITID